MIKISQVPYVRAGWSWPLDPPPPSLPLILTHTTYNLRRRSTGNLSGNLKQQGNKLRKRQNSILLHKLPCNIFRKQMIIMFLELLPEKLFSTLFILISISGGHGLIRWVSLTMFSGLLNACDPVYRCWQYNHLTSWTNGDWWRPVAWCTVEIAETSRVYCSNLGWIKNCVFWCTFTHCFSDRQIFSTHACKLIVPIITTLTVHYITPLFSNPVVQTRNEHFSQILPTIDPRPPISVPFRTRDCLTVFLFYFFSDPLSLLVDCSHNSLNRSDRTIDLCFTQLRYLWLLGLLVTRWSWST